MSKKITRFTLSIDYTLLTALKILSAKKGKSTSDIINECIIGSLLYKEELEEIKKQLGE